MTESQAWLKIAEAFEEGNLEELQLDLGVRGRIMHNYGILSFDTYSMGICSAITSLFKNNKINEIIRSKMKSRLYLYGHMMGFKLDSLFWEVNSEGAAQRNKVCKMMSVECTKDASYFRNQHKVECECDGCFYEWSLTTRTCHEIQIEADAWIGPAMRYLREQERNNYNGRS